MTLFEKDDETAIVRATLIQPRATQTQAIREGLSLRCENAGCKLRSTAGGSAGPHDMLGEIDAADRAPDWLELMRAELADAEADEAGGSQAAGGGVSAPPIDATDGQECIVELWHFAHSVQYWTTVLAEMAEGREAQVVAIVTPSAQQGPWLAARALASDVYVLTRRQNAHARRHEWNLGESMREAELAPAEEAALRPDPGARYQCILAVLVGDQRVIEAYTVGAGNLWRDGVNRGSSGEVPLAAAGRLVAEQLDINGLSIPQRGGAWRATT